MTRQVATVATVAAGGFLIGSLYFLLAGNYFVAGTLLTFVAFSIYFRETNLA